MRMSEEQRKRCFFFCNTGFSRKQYYYTPDVLISRGRESSTAKPIPSFFFLVTSLVLRSLVSTSDCVSTPVFSFPSPSKKKKMVKKERQQLRFCCC